MKKRRGKYFLCNPNEFLCPKWPWSCLGSTFKATQSGSQKQLKKNSSLYLNLSKHCKRAPVQTLQTLKNPFPLFSSSPQSLTSSKPETSYPCAPAFSGLLSLPPLCLFLSNLLLKCLRFGTFFLLSFPLYLHFPQQKRILKRTLQLKPVALWPLLQPRLFQLSPVLMLRTGWCSSKGRGGGREGGAGGREWAGRGITSQPVLVLPL